MFTNESNNRHSIGEFDRYVGLYELQESQSDTNSLQLTKVKLRDIWVKHIAADEGESFDDKIRTLDVHHYVTHWDPDVSTRMPETLAIEDNERLYFCFGMDEIVRGTFIRLKCEARDVDTVI